jgi:hypothetical protein
MARFFRVTKDLTKALILLTIKKCCDQKQRYCQASGIPI